MRSGIIFAFAVSFLAPACAAQEPAKRPDLAGTWTNESLTTLSRPRGVAELVVSEERAKELIPLYETIGFVAEGAPVEETSDPKDGAPKAGDSDFGVKAYDQFWVSPGDNLARVKGEYRTSFVVDPANGRVPFLPRRPRSSRDYSEGERYQSGIGGNEGPDVLPLWERCLIGFSNTGGPGMLPALYNNTYQFIQTDDHVVFVIEMNHDARVVPTFESAEKARASHLPNAIKPWLGDSVGWYEDDALVVETTNMKPAQAAEVSIPISDSGRIVERFTRISPTEIFYQFEVEDPTLYSQPWRAELSFYTTKERQFEYACHEGNHAMTGILAGGREKEREAANTAKAKSAKRG